MMDSTFDLPGWTSAVDPRTGRQYYINLSEKTTTWEDPRLKLKHIYGPGIPMQALHGSPKNVQVYPTQSYPTQAFQNDSGLQVNVNASPVPSTRTSHYTTHTGHTVEMSSLSRSSPHTPRVGNLIKHQQMLSQQHMQETSFSSPTPMETDATVAKINSMFPTASEHHIRLLLKKYLKSMFPKAEETIILDVLATVENNVQKASEQLSRMGFEKKELTPAPRLSHRKKDESNGSSSRKQHTVAEPTPPPKPKTADEKKKLKARMQAQYKDQIPERVISMALESVDYSEEKALKILDIVQQEDSKKKSEKDKKNAVDRNVSFKEPSLKSNKSIDLDKAAAIENDETMIINSDHTIITTPVESPQTDVIDNAGRSPRKPSKRIEGKENLLQVSESEDITPTSDGSFSDANITAEKGKKKQRYKARSESSRSTKMDTKKNETKSAASKKETFTTVSSKSIVMEDGKDGKFLSIVRKSVAQGASLGLAKGPRDDLLLSDYVAWNGANPDIIQSTKVKAMGANPSLLRSDRAYARGPNNALCKGPQVKAIGSIYAQRNQPNVACN